MVVDYYGKDKTKVKLNFVSYHHMLSKSPFGPQACLIPETQAMLKYLPGPATHPDAVDIGSGQGGWTMVLRGAGYRTKSLDMDNSQFDCTVGDMHEIPFEDNSFDVVFCTGTFEHAFAPFIVLSEFKRIARNNAVILITLPKEDNIQMLEDEAHYSIFSRLQLEHMFCKKLNIEIFAHEEGLYDKVVGPHQIFAMRVHK